MKITNLKCTQCGSSDFNREGEENMRCSYCLSLYVIEQPKKNEENKAGVIIMKGANVTFGENSDVTITGGLEIQDGAKVEFNGKLELIEKSSHESIEKAKSQLKKLKDD